MFKQKKEIKLNLNEKERKALKFVLKKGSINHFHIDKETIMSLKDKGMLRDSVYYFELTDSAKKFRKELEKELFNFFERIFLKR